MRKQTKIWTTKDGQKIRICDMGDKHLANTIALLERQANVATSKAVIDGYAMLSCLRGEMAIDSVERELDSLEENGIDPSELCPLYDNLVLERLRR